MGDNKIERVDWGHVIDVGEAAAAGTGFKKSWRSFMVGRAIFFSTLRILNY
jgi:hypothetical protein